MSIWGYSGDRFRGEKPRQSPQGSLLDQSQFSGPGDSLGSAVYVQLVVDVLNVVFDGANSNSQSLSDLGVAGSRSDQTHYLKLSCRQWLHHS